MKLNRALITVLLLGLVLALIGCTGGGGSTGGGYGTPPAETPANGSDAAATTVTMKGFAFDPAALDVKVGDTVTFVNGDSAPHDVKIDGKDLGVQDPGASVTWTAASTGSFPYVCTIHPSMAGEITVK